MSKRALKIAVLIATTASVGAITACVTAQQQGQNDGSRNPASVGYEAYEAKQLTMPQKVGREIWYKATGNSQRYLTYLFAQRVAAGAIDYDKFFKTTERDQRFTNWGLISDPGCCTPGEDCKAKGRKLNGKDVTMEDTFGWDYCEGDEELLRYVGNSKEKYRDPACDLANASNPVHDTDWDGDPKAPWEGKGNADWVRGALKQNPCDLHFGTSSGALGFRKFPNPRFDAKKWADSGGWAGYRKTDDNGFTKLSDHSIEPPFRVGVSCGSCHIAFNPLYPPANPNKATWDNIIGTVGNQYMKNAVMMGSGMLPNSTEYHSFKYERPGTTDTSGIPNDFVKNEGSMNAIINFPKRPVFPHDINTWRYAKNGCTPDNEEQKCWCEPGKQGKCWERSKKLEKVHHVLKGGEDNIGDAGSVQRVYINIGACAETCWLNHLTDFRVLDSNQRNYGQTPFDINQCRRDCPSFRAIEDRVPEIRAFLFTARPAELFRAKSKELAQMAQKSEQDVTRTDLKNWLETTATASDGQKYGKGAVEAGRQVFVTQCSKCHSTQAKVAPGGPVADNTQFFDVDKYGVRIDWLGTDERKPAKDIGTYGCRAMHSNHKKGHVWEEYASETYQAEGPVKGLEKWTGGGNGKYRNISLLNLWAYAPFMHNNAIGPEICADKPEMYTSSYSDQNGQTLPNPPACVPFSKAVSVDDRFAIFQQSVRSLLNPAIRREQLKIEKTDVEIKIPLITNLVVGTSPKPVNLAVKIPPGSAVARLGSFRHKDFARDFAAYIIATNDVKEGDEEGLKKAEAGFKAAVMDKQWKPLYSDVEINTVITTFRETKASAKTAIHGDGIITAQPSRLKIYTEFYSNCVSFIEDSGHTFAEGLNAVDKRALEAFLAML